MKRFSALVAALVMCFCLSVPSFAAFNDDFNLPSQAEFDKHPKQWYVVKTGGFYYLFGCSFTVSSSGPSYASGVATNPVSSTMTNTSSFLYTLWYADAIVPDYFVERFPLPFGYSRFQLLAFPSSSPKPSSARLFCVDVSDLPTGGVIGNGNLYDIASGPVYRVPVYLKADEGNNHTSLTLSGPSSSSFSSSSSYVGINLTDFYPLTFYAGDWEYTRPYSSNKVIYSNNLALTAASIRTASGSFDTSDMFFFAYSFRAFSSTFDALYGADYKTGSWFPADEDLQNELVNQFGVDSGTLSDSKSSLDSWSNTSSIDSDVASSASGLLGGVFQNLGTFLFSVSLLCFGAVVLRMLIKKAVS